MCFSSLEYLENINFDRRNNSSRLMKNISYSRTTEWDNRASHMTERLETNITCNKEKTIGKPVFPHKLCTYAATASSSSNTFRFMRAIV